jgi:dihydroorotase
LVDLHTHLFAGVSHYGVDADTYCVSRGVTTAVDAGSAGGQTFPGFARYVVAPAATRILAFLNISLIGMIVDTVGELEDLRYASVPDAVAIARDHAHLIVGIKVRLGEGRGTHDDPVPALRRGRQAADELGLPLMVHISDMVIPVTDVVRHLGAGDIVTHAFTGRPGSILDPDGRIRDGVIDARRRGVVFDVGHGRSSFSYGVARSCLAQGFPPDTISSDLHAHDVHGPAYDEVTTLSKLLHLGMSMPDAVDAATRRPADVIGKGHVLGRLSVGGPADITILGVRGGPFDLPSGPEETETVPEVLSAVWAIRAGVAHPCSQAPLRGVSVLPPDEDALDA